MDPAWREPERSLLSLDDEEGLAAELKAAGFADIRVFPRVHTFEVPSAIDLWRGMERSNVLLALMRMRLGEAIWAARSPEAVASLERELRRAGDRLSTKGLLGYGTKR
ncbi:MAG: hypothetical protein JOZ69_18030 [Myxococcales bacterium]|nr:hypothetical protein [Myxococcales bacterium]